MNSATTEEDVVLKLWKSTQTMGEKLTPFENFQAVKALYSKNMSMEETIRFLHYERPNECDFLNWVNQYADESLEDVSEDHYELLPEDWEFWNENGYFVIKKAIDDKVCERVEQAIWNFLDASPENPESWYKSHPSKSGMMVLFTQHESLRAVRNSGKIKSVYEQLYGTSAIHKTIDKVSFNPPETENHKFTGSKLHWDVSLSLPIPFKLQGLLYLANVGKDEGAFHCVPGFHNEIENWMKKVPAGCDIRGYALNNLTAKPVIGEKGDFIIWHQALPHCASPNNGTKPRLVQYLTYLPNDGELQKEWI